MQFTLTGFGVLTIIGLLKCCSLTHSQLNSSNSSLLATNGTWTFSLQQGISSSSSARYPMNVLGDCFEPYTATSSINGTTAFTGGSDIFLIAAIAKKLEISPIFNLAILSLDPKEIEDRYEYSRRKVYSNYRALRLILNCENATYWEWKLSIINE